MHFLSPRNTFHHNGYRAPQPQRPTRHRVMLLRTGSGFKAG
jgi:hypothetical protein